MSTKRLLFVLAIVLLAGVLAFSSANAQVNRSGTNSDTPNYSNTLFNTSDDSDTSDMDDVGEATSTGTSTPGAPNTGFGDSAMMNIAILLGSAIVAVGGATLVARRMTV